MADQSSNADLAIAGVKELISPGILGFYTQFESTEIFAVRDGQTAPLNIFSMVVAEDRLDAPPQPFRYINPSRIRLKTLKGWSFGIAQYSRPIAELIPRLENLRDKGEWRASGQALSVAKLSATTRQFAPPNSAREPPWNRDQSDPSFQLLGVNRPARCSYVLYEPELAFKASENR